MTLISKLSPTQKRIYRSLFAPQLDAFIHQDPSAWFKTFKKHLENMLTTNYEILGLKLIIINHKYIL